MPNLDCYIAIIKYISFGEKAWDWVSFTRIYDGTAESVEQDQTARMCSLILLYALRIINQWLRKGMIRVKLFSFHCCFALTKL